ncbi:hypothetical protein PR202_ga18910 [Eleusine coracana subsp. coracana]|uniref:non-specific serine/threonine protein kinase n=1 Tax=Eleusine coracana subsp. coracana TaxID=191504 RepID=A0AAV5CU06_ELECO|nr:hypothetical protein PR202_ga18910 [Eleusine coracana subsp. coracana]
MPSGDPYDADEVVVLDMMMRSCGLLPPPVAAHASAVPCLCHRRPSLLAPPLPYPACVTATLPYSRASSPLLPCSREELHPNRIRRLGPRRAGVLSDFDGRTVWETQNNIAMTGATAMLLDTRNLVLRSPNGTVIWQSIDHPTHNILPGMRLLLIHRPHLARRLVA